MVCERCGRQVEDNAVFCRYCGDKLKEKSNEGRMYSNNNEILEVQNKTIYDDLSSKKTEIHDHMIWSILVTILCNLPLGIIAIIFSYKVGSKLKTGDYKGAADASRIAKILCWIAFGLGVIVILFIILILIISIITGKLIPSTNTTRI